MIKAPEIGSIIYSTNDDEIKYFDGTDWQSLSGAGTDYQMQLENIPVEEIEKYLRKLKLDRIKNNI